MVTKLFTSPKFRFNTITLFLKDYLKQGSIVGYSSYQFKKYYARLKSLVQGYDEIILDENGTILTWNPSYEKLKGYREAEIIGQHLNLFFLPQHRQSKVAQSLLDEAAQRGTATKFGQFIRKDGSILWGSI